MPPEGSIRGDIRTEKMVYKEGNRLMLSVFSRIETTFHKLCYERIREVNKGQLKNSQYCTVCQLFLDNFSALIFRIYSSFSFIYYSFVLTVVVAQLASNIVNHR